MVAVTKPLYKAQTASLFLLISKKLGDAQINYEPRATKEDPPRYVDVSILNELTAAIKHCDFIDNCLYAVKRYNKANYHLSACCLRDVLSRLGHNPEKIEELQIILQSYSSALIRIRYAQATKDDVSTAVHFCEAMAEYYFPRVENADNEYPELAKATKALTEHAR